MKKVGDLFVFAQSNGTVNDDEMFTMPHYEPQKAIFLSLIHVAVKRRRDLMDTPVGHLTSARHSRVCLN